MSQVIESGPAVINADVLKTSIKVEPLTCTIGAELSNVNLGVASRDSALVAEIRSLLLKYKVLFFRDQDITRAEHVAFARHFGEFFSKTIQLPGVTLRTPVSFASTNRPISRTTATKTLGIPTPPGARNRRSALYFAASNVRRWEATRCGPIWPRPITGCPVTSSSRLPVCALAIASRQRSERRCRSRSAWH